MMLAVFRAILPTNRRVVWGVRHEAIAVFVTACLLSVVLLSLPPSGQAASQVEAALEAAFKGDSSLRRFEAIETLGAIGTPEAIRALVTLTADDNNAWLAVRQLVALKDRSVPALMEALSGQNPKVVKHAVYALGELKRTEAVVPILGYLNHSDPEIRQNAVFALGYIRDPRAVEPLMARLRDSDNVVREYAAAALENFRDPRAIPMLKDALIREEGSVFNMATALYSLGDTDVIDLLIEKLKDPRAGNRLYAVYALGKIRDPREVEPLIESLTDENVQWLAVKALINLGDMAVPALMKAVGRRQREIRLSAIYALGEIGDKRSSKLLLDNLIDPDAVIRDYTTDALIKISDRETVPRLLFYLEKGDATIQAQVLHILGSIGDTTVVDSVLPLLISSYPQVRMNAAFALGELRETRAAPNLVALLGDSHQGVSSVAANALIKLGTESTATLIEMLATATGSTETGVIYILGKLRAAEAVGPIVQKLTSSDPYVRRHATIALTEIGDPGTEERLVMMLSDRDPQVRMYASVGLMQFGGRLAVRLLIESLRSEETRWLAVRILDRIGTKGVDDLMIALKDQYVRGDAADTLIRLDGEAIPALQRGLRSEDETIRNNVAMILGEVRDKQAVAALLEAMTSEPPVVPSAAASLVKIGDPAAVEPLIECLRHENEQIRLYAAWALGGLGDQRAVDPLVKILRDPVPEVRGIAAHALGLLKARKAVNPLVEAINDPDENVRMSIVHALGRIGERRTAPAVKERYLKDGSEKVRQAARETLDLLTPR
jgi:HEAT repeat protein